MKDRVSDSIRTLRKSPNSTGTLEFWPKTKDFDRFSQKHVKRVLKNRVLIRLGLWKKTPDPTRILRKRVLIGLGF